VVILSLIGRLLPRNQLTKLKIKQVRMAVLYFQIGAVIIPVILIGGIPIFMQIFIPMIILCVLGGLLFAPFVITGEFYRVSRNRLLVIFQERRLFIKNPSVFFESLLFIFLSFPLLVVFLHHTKLDGMFSVVSYYLFEESNEALTFWNGVNTVIDIISFHIIIHQFLDSIKVITIKIIILGVISEIYLIVGKIIHYQIRKTGRYSPGRICWNMGIIHYSKGEIQTAMEYFNKSHNYFNTKKDTKGLSHVLALLVVVNTDLGFIEEANIFLDQLMQLKTKIKQKEIDNLAQLAKGYTLKTSTRILDKGKALEVFLGLSVEHFSSPYFVRFSLLNLSELLIFELNTTGEERILKEIERTIQMFADYAGSQKSLRFLIYAVLIQAKLALVEADITKAQRLIIQAEKLAIESNISELSNLVTYEHYSLFFQLVQHRTAFNPNTPIQERLQASQLEELVKIGIHKKMEEVPDDFISDLSELRAFQEYMQNLPYD
jgi:tetratricopeptide (TPR) repeat protein